MFHNLRHYLQTLVWFLLALATATLVFGGSVIGNGARIVFIYVVVSLVFAALAYLQDPNPRVHDGWRYITPGAMAWVALLGCFALTLLLLWVYYFVGSARADAASQMVALKLLILVFALGAAIVFYGSFATELRWNQHTIEQHQPFQATKTIQFADIVDGGMNPLAQSVWIAASDGTTIHFSPYANGAEALARTIFQPERKAPTR